jgi:hypothetical protein
MAYDKAKLSIETETRHHRSFSYRDATTTLAGIKAAAFFVGLADYGAVVNDSMWIAGSNGAEMVRVSAISSAGAGTVV